MILKINDRLRTRKVEFFNNFQLDLKYDSVASGFSFGFYFDPNNPEHKELACIGHYHKATIEHNDELLISGIITSEGFESAPERKLVAIAGYSYPGFLEDCQISPKSYPLQNDGLTLKQIADKVVSPFGLTIVVDPSVSSLMNEAYEKTTASATQTVKDYLTSLAAQKNIIITHDEKGRLVFTKAKAQRAPIMDFDLSKGSMPGTTMSLAYNGQVMHSDITVMKQPDKDGGNAGEYTIKNPYVPYVYRPRVVVQNSGDDIDTEKAARNALADELRGLSLKISTDRWEVNGKIIKPNNTITVINPEIYLYKKMTWFIESIAFTGDESKTTAVMNCVPKEVYSGDYPVYPFKGINLH